VSGPLPPESASASAEVGAAARSDAVALGVAEPLGAAVGLADADADAVPLGDAVAPGRVDAEPPTVPGVDPVLAGDRGAVAVVFGDVGFGADVVGLGLVVVFVGAGSLVFVGAGGATRGC
jgi:hypothetical protein